MRTCNKLTSSSGHSKSIRRGGCTAEIQAELDLEWAGARRTGNWRNFDDINDAEYLTWLKQIVSRTGVEDDEGKAFFDKIQRDKIRVVPGNHHIFRSQYGTIKQYYDRVPTEGKTPEWEKRAVQVCMNALKVPDDSSLESFKQEVLGGSTTPQTFPALMVQVLTTNQKTEQAIALVGRLHNKRQGDPITDPEDRDGSRHKKTKNRTERPTRQVEPTRPAAPAHNTEQPGSVVRGSKNACWICGNVHKAECRLKGCSWAINDTTKHWAASDKGKEWARKGWKWCPPKEDAGTFNEGETIYCLTCRRINKMLTYSSSIDTSLIPCTLLYYNSQHTGREAKLLLDTGAITDNFIDRELANELVSQGSVIINKSVTVAGGITDACQKCHGSISIRVKVIDEFSKERTFGFQALIIDSPFDLIVGRNTIKRLNLVKYYPSHFFNDNEVTTMLARHVSDGALVVSPKSDGEEEDGSYDNGEFPVLMSMVRQQDGASNISSISDAYEREDIDEIDDDYLQSIPTDMVYNTMANLDGSLQLPPERAFHGPDTLQVALKDLVLEYKDRFRSTVTGDPARVTPYQFKADELLWNIPKHQSGTRHMEQTRLKEMKKQIDLFLEAGIIRPSRAAYYSHAFLVPKPNLKWRFVVDYKNLNAVSVKEGWPIPNIKLMLERIGDKRPKYFIVLDLTSGYFQAEIDEECKKYTAFITPWGLYEWNRLPMGLSGAPSYFQRTLSTQVLPGLLTVACELYLDDLVIFADSEDELVSRFRQVLERFKEFNIYINPEKCQMGMSEVTYVGHTINATGRHFTRERLDSVMNFPLPETQKGLKKFTSFVQYFHEHVENLATMVKPLNMLLNGYNKRSPKKIAWTEELKESFERIKEAIHNCPSLFFVDDASPIYLYTDASDYGIGAYLYQLVDGVERPIGFISKAFDERMARWDVPQKEGYAIYYALDKWDYLLRDRFFILRTDHENLTLLKENYKSNKKVQRWLRCYQGYHYGLEFTKGVDNPVADGFSRLCSLLSYEIEEETILNTGVTLIQVPRSKWKILRKVHNELVGHVGVDKMMARLQENGHDWEYMREHVKQFKLRCPTCQKNDQSKPHNQTSQPFTLSSNDPMYKIFVDIIEDLREDEEGNRHILVLIDAFSRWLNLIPMKDKTSLTIAKKLFQHVGDFGVPIELVSDRGPGFIGDVVEEFLRLIGTEHNLTMAYSKEENGMVERANKETMRHLRNIVFDRNVIHNWSTYLPLVKRIFNSSVHSVTGVAPANVLFGMVLDLNRNLFDSTNTLITQHSSMSEWVASLIEGQQTIINLVQTNLQKEREQHVARHTNANFTIFPINSYVLVEHVMSNLRRGPKSKLLPFLKGPMKVVSNDGDKYKLRNLITRKDKDYHVSRL